MQAYMVSNKVFEWFHSYADSVNQYLGFPAVDYKVNLD